MPRLTTRICVAAAAASVLVAAAGAASLVQPADRPNTRPAGQTVSVERAMKTMNRAMRQLRKVVGDAAQRDEALRLVNDMQRGCLDAKSQPVPKDILEQAADDAARAKLAGTFRHDLIELMRQLLDLETLIDAGKTQEATAKLAEIVQLRDHSHKEMGVSDEPSGNPPPRE